ncbi:MAG: hypothetical protein EPN23_11295 [Verrucomicrobia bacterium]|nr:MAG: hypothetical protein EPN23_11295 [Verrucomicrobiota bacterium]
MTTIDDPFAHFLPNTHEGVRKSGLMRALHERLAQLSPGAFPFAMEFERLRNVVAPQIGETRVLFPEFTPHDEEHHIVKLFQLADRLFGNTYPQLKAVELYLLGCALYAHDWGMAVGAKERNYLLHGAKDKDLDNSFTPLSDEAERLTAFARSIGVRPPAEDVVVPLLSEDQLRLYVRFTHARRSGARVRAHFYEHPALGQALAHLCEGHWHDFATLDDPQRFPREYEVLDETAHLLALALHVRLIDLFHITDDRTPYALWRFVSPTDSKSAEEWRKHRALHGITCTDYPPGRAIKVQGFTEDEEVWAGLQDLHRYCENQVNHTLDLAARHVPQRYGLDYVKLEWAVTTGGLRPVHFAFSFDRTAMFRILSDDIYDGERRVFLRELLQNSIDAIRTRCCRHTEQRAQQQKKRHQSGPSFDTTIYFLAEHQENGDIHVTCRDNGIGMDEHIIRNYFTVAGASYYRSTEFDSLHLGFEPISRFGIGILSCFMVADSIQVKTYRDPDCGPPMAQSDLKLPGAEAHSARRLHLTIPAVDRQFVVKEAENDFSVGTEVSLNVLSRKVTETVNNLAIETKPDDAVSQYQPKDFKRTLEITEYLCEIAGFVDFPIHVEERWPGQESPSMTLILHPDCDSEQERKDFDPATVVHQLSREYPWEAVTAPESLQPVRELMTSYCLELKDLLGDEGYEGWVNFPVPQTDDFAEPPNISFSSRDQLTTVLRRASDAGWTDQIVYWRTEKYIEAKNLPKELFGIYRDGIRLSGLLPDNLADETNWLSPTQFGNTLPPPSTFVNLKSSRLPAPNVSRTALNISNDSWDIAISKAIKTHLAYTEIQAALELNPENRLYRLGWLQAVFHLTPKELSQMVPESKKICIYLMPPCELQYRERHEISGAVPEMPEAFFDLIYLLAMKQRFQCDRNIDFQWEGPASIVQSSDSTYVSEGISIPMREAFACAGQWSRVVPELVQFLEPPKGETKLLYQMIGKLSESPEKDIRSRRWSFEPSGSMHHWHCVDALKAAIVAPTQMTPSQAMEFENALGRPIPVPFAEPFDSFLAVHSHQGNSWRPTEGLILNSSLDVGIAASQCLAACNLAMLEQRLSYAAADEYQQLTSLNAFEDSVNIDATSFVSHLFTFVKKENLIEGFCAPEIQSKDLIVPRLSDDSIIPASEEEKVHWRGRPGRCGRLIKQWPLPNEDVTS